MSDPVAQAYARPHGARRPDESLLSAEPLQILVADDSADFRAGLGALLASVDDMSVVGDATDGDAAIAAALDLQPDVVLMDLNMPGRTPPRPPPPSAARATARPGGRP